MLATFFLIAGLYMVFKREIRISSKRSIKGKIAQKIGIIFIAPALLSYVIKLIPESSFGVILAYISLASFALAFISIFYFTFFYRSNENKNDSEVLSLKTEPSKITEEQNNKNKSNNFFRKDLNLKNRWWHRLLLVIFVVSFLAILGFTISNMLDDAQLPKYTKVEMLSDRMDSEIRLIGSLIKPKEKIAVYEHSLYGEYNGKTFYDRNGGWLVEQKYYCSKNVSDQVEKITAKTGVNYYWGTTGLDSLSNFKSYLAQNKATCVSVNPYNPLDKSETREKLMWGFEPDGMVVWQESLGKSIFVVLQTIVFVALGFIILLVIYYKIFLFIVFGSKKE